MVVVTILGTVGFFGFGASIGAQTHWSGPVLTYGFANMALAFASTCVFGYVLVCFRIDLMRGLKLADRKERTATPSSRKKRSWRSIHGISLHSVHFSASLTAYHPC
jgi:hypothetical protein